MKPDRLITQDGIFYLDRKSGFYEPESEREPLPYRGVILVLSAIIGWIAFIGLGFCAYRAFEAFAG